MDITLYRNHTPDCKKLLAGTTYRRLSGVKQKKAIVRHRECNCQWWYRRKGDPHGKATGHADEAKNVVNRVRGDSKDPEVHGRKLYECITMYTGSLNALARTTLKHYRLMFAALQTFADQCEITHIRQITPEFIVNFKNRALL